MPDQLDLFAEAKQGKADGMGRAEDHADESWKEAALTAVFDAAVQQPLLTTEHVLPLINPNAVTHDLRALGPIMVNAAKAGWIEKAKGMMPVPSARRHMAPLTVWKSLLFKDEAA